MSHRKPTTFNHKTFKGIDLNTKQYPLIDSNLNKIYEILKDATRDFPRITAFRIDLRYPQDYEVDRREGVITRFFRSLESQLYAELKRRKSKGKSVSRECLRYIWCKEIESSKNPHFHIVIILNKDNFRSLGDYKNFKSRRRNCKHFYHMVVDAWSRVLGIEQNEAHQAVYVPENPTYYVFDRHPFDDCIYEDDEESSFEQMFNELFNRVVYLAKYRTRAYGTGRTFGTNRRSRQDRERQFLSELVEGSMFDQF